MASTFKELGDDVLMYMSVYTEKLVITNEALMRFMTKGMSLLQREATVAETSIVLTRSDATTRFVLPDDVLFPTMLVDATGNEIINQEFDQLQRQAERATTGYLDSPYPRSERVRFDSGYGVGSLGERCFGRGTYRNYAIHDYEIYLLPDTGDTELTFYYVPNVEPISHTSTQWEDWYASNMANFDALYASVGPVTAFQPYEDAIVKYAVSCLLKTQAGPNRQDYKVFEGEFWAEVKRAIDNKPVMYRDGVAEYYMSPGV